MTINLTNEQVVKEAIFRALCVLVVPLGLSVSPSVLLVISTALAHIFALIYTGKITSAEQAESYARARAEMPDFASLKVDLTREAAQVLARPDDTL